MERPTAQELYRRHGHAIFRFLQAATRDRTLAEDLTQEVFVRVVRGLERYDPRERDLAWLFRIARRLLLDHGRTEQRRPRLVREEEVVLPPVPPVALEGLSLAEALSSLPTSERDAFLLREVGGLGYDEIASATGGTAAAVRNRIFRARDALRRALAPALARARGRAGKESPA
ncbi:MAG TPA: RNA polymerase sigma factor [Candidatus Polarisedimenticolaceae bacterium]|nr:RNA polymerase sigma factor [Candidatus Polarisedimenticolaceae bacterium]